MKNRRLKFSEENSTRGGVLFSVRGEIVVLSTIFLHYN